MKVKLKLGDCLDVLKKIPDNVIDSCVTDPPYGLSFMGKKWDTQVPSVEIWREIYRVLKPGAHLLSFFGTRTYHRGVVNIEDAGFEIRDMVSWVYGSGFPKSTNIGKEIDKIQKNERIIIGQDKSGSKRNCMAGDFVGGVCNLTQGKSKWEGWGTALKPAQEPIVLARKPLGEKNIASNVLKYRTGAINIDDCRVESGLKQKTAGLRIVENSKGWGINQGGCSYEKGTGAEFTTEGRFPANFIHDGSDEVVELFPKSSYSGFYKQPGTEKIIKKDWDKHIFKDGNKIRSNQYAGETGSAARFFYCPKTSVKEREQGLEKKEDEKSNIHPTVKPVDLMKYLCRLITPPKGIILDPFMGSGSTGMAALQEDFSFIGIEKEEQYFNIAEQRIKSVIEKEDVFC